MKVILPVAGKGVRMFPHTIHRPKCLLPVGGNTILGHILDSLKDLNVDEYIFVTGYHAEAVEEYIQEEYGHLNSRFVRQENPQGLGEAIHLTMPYMQEDVPALIILGDTLFAADLETITKETKNNILCTRYVENPERFGVAITDENNRIQELREKPQTLVSNQALVGIYWINDISSLQNALAQLVAEDIRTQGELQLTDALASMLAKGKEFYTAPIQEWLDCGKHETLLETNAYLCANYQATQGNQVEYSNSTIIPPCIIAPGAKITNSVIGPNVMIASGAEVDSCEIKESVIDKRCYLKACNISHSIISNDSKLENASGVLQCGAFTLIKKD
jgi:glucose-1-phosphate thymidylyltransferase